MTGEEWAQIRLLTDGYSIKRNEAQDMHTLFTELMELERDLHQHVHLENNVLFRRAIDEGWLE
jgi:regulator of cell morphogenesis and NO signaling